MREHSSSGSVGGKVLETFQMGCGGHPSTVLNFPARLLAQKHNAINYPAN